MFGTSKIRARARSFTAAQDADDLDNRCSHKNPCDPATNHIFLQNKHSWATLLESSSHTVQAYPTYPERPSHPHSM